MKLGLMIDSVLALSAYAPYLVASGIAPHAEALGRCWSLSRARLRHWQSRLQHLNTDATHDATVVENTLADLFVDELATRVMAAVFVVSDAAQHVSDAGPIGRNIFLGHLEARQAALRMLVSGQLPEESVILLDRLRRRVERWSDLLLGHLVVRFGCDEFAINPERARDFGAEQLGAGGAQRTLWDLSRQSLRAALLEFDAGEPLAEKLRDNLARATISWLPPALPNECDVLNPSWTTRLLQPTRAFANLSGEDLAYWSSHARQC